MATEAPEFEAVVLAAGAGRRFGGGKLLAPWAGGALLDGALAAALAAPARRVIVVTGTAAAEVSRPGLVGKVEMGVMRLAARGPALPAGVFVRSRHQRHLNFGDNPDPRDIRLVRKAIAGTTIRDMGSYFRALETMDERASLAALATVPTTILVGEKDRLTPVPLARALHHGIPGSELVEVPGKGHMLGYEATDLVVDALLATVA